jgi:hypothetical protein
VGIDELNLGPFVEDAATERIGCPGLHLRGAIVFGMAAGNGHVLEDDTRVRSDDLEHTIRHGLLDRGPTTEAHKKVGLYSRPSIADVEVTRSPCHIVSSGGIGER